MHESDLPTAGPGLAAELDQLRRWASGWPSTTTARGGSSMINLRRLPVDTLKIDRSFVAGCLDDPADAAIVEAVAAAGRATGRHLIAAGVENREQLHRLRDLGYHTVQGHLTGAARPLDELSDVIQLRDIDLDRG